MILPKMGYMGRKLSSVEVKHRIAERKLSPSQLPQFCWTPFCPHFSQRSNTEQQQSSCGQSAHSTKRGDKDWHHTSSMLKQITFTKITEGLQFQDGLFPSRCSMGPPSYGIKQAAKQQALSGQHHGQWPPAEPYPEILNNFRGVEMTILLQLQG